MSKRNGKGFNPFPPLGLNLNIFPHSENRLFIPFFLNQILKQSEFLDHFHQTGSTQHLLRNRRDSARHIIQHRGHILFRNRLLLDQNDGARAIDVFLKPGYRTSNSYRNHDDRDNEPFAADRNVNIVPDFPLKGWGCATPHIFKAFSFHAMLFHRISLHRSRKNYLRPTPTPCNGGTRFTSSLFSVSSARRHQSACQSR